MNTRLLLAVCGSAVAAACASSLYVHQPPPAPPTAGGPIVGINAFYDGPEAPDVVDRICAWGPVVARSTISSVEIVPAILQAASTCPRLSLILLVGTTDDNLATALIRFLRDHPSSQVIGIEWGNEVDLQDIPAPVFGRFVGRAIAAAHAAELPQDQITGGISNVRPEKLAWADQAMDAAAAVGVPWTGALFAFHRYAELHDAAVPQRGYNSRSDENAAIRAAARGLLPTLTEYGHCLGDGYTVQGAADNDEIDLRWAAQLGAVHAINYQIASGPGATCLDSYGVRDFAGAWRTPIEAVFMRWAGR
jgi:hypothetical protein